MICVQRELGASFILISGVVSAGFFSSGLYTLGCIGGMGDARCGNNHIIGLAHNSSEDLALTD